MPRLENKWRENTGVSEVVGTLILIGVVMVGIALASVFLLSRPTASKVPVFDAIISNQSNTIYIYHKGGDPLYSGQYQILVDGVDRTSSFTNSGGLGPTDLNWSVGETLSATISPMPNHVVIVFNPAGGKSGGGGSSGAASLLTEADLTPLLKVPSRPPNAPPSIIWFSSPGFGNISTQFLFNDTSTGVNLTSNSYSWIFNDGDTASTQNATNTFSCGVNPSCIYDIDHSVTDSPGTDWAITSWLNRSAYVTVYKNLTPTVTFTEDRTSGPAGLLHFYGTQVGPIHVDSWYWTFGDGGTSNLQNPTNTYASQGAYTVTLQATNFTLGQTSANVLLHLTPPWYNCAWLYRKNITLNGTAVSGSLQYFPVLISYTGSDLSNALPSGNDILFTDFSGTTKIPHEIETFTQGTGALVAWVNVSSLTSGTNTTIYLYYDYPGVSSSMQDAAHVWDSNYQAVWHLKESGSGSAGEFKDSTKNANHGTGGASGASPTLTQSGVADGAQSFDGSNDYIGLGTSGTLQPSTLTFSFWINRGTASWNGQHKYLFWAKGNDETDNGWYVDAAVQSTLDYPINLVVNGNNGFNGPQVTDSTFYPSNTWTYMVVTFSSGTAQIYKNAVSQTVTSYNSPTTISTTSDTKYLSHWPSTGNYTQSTWDEVRISNSVRSSSWITTEFNNQNWTSHFDYPMAAEANPAPC